MPQTFTHQFDTPLYKGTATVNTGLFINGEFVDPVEGGTIEYVAVLPACSELANTLQCLRPRYAE